MGNSNVVKSLELAEVALEEAIRLDDALQIADTKHHRFDKTVKYAIALRDVGRLTQASEVTDDAEVLAEQLRELDWPLADAVWARVEELRTSHRVRKKGA